MKELKIDDASRQPHLSPKIASRFGVQGIPTLMLARDGKEVDRLVGAAPKPQLESWLENHLAASAT